MARNATRITRTLLRTAVTMFAIANIFPLTSAVANAAYPDHPIRWIAPFPPGALSDIVTRVVARALEEEFKQSVVVENKPGASGTIAAAEAANSPADGHTLVTVSASNITLAPILRPDLTYDPAKDFALISTMTKTSLVLVAGQHFPANTMEELIKLAKSQPGKITYASSGIGSSPNILCELLKAKAGIDLLHVPYQGGAQAYIDLMAGAVDLTCSDYPTASGFIASGKIKAIAILGKERIDRLPDVPASAEFGIDSFDNLAGWIGVAVPSKTPDDVKATLYSAIERAMKRPEVAAAIQKFGADPDSLNPDAFTKMVEQESETYRQFLANSGIAIK